ncbi:hypothetical protein BS47DRAFT_1370016 [Hydnum rufescens UP504]|uniref:Uncharacterized protein n=1 Tax=Hydnum rufescens UP504 TaxID=1448309 RepID=A0A9P6ACC0_9AGAM|nr:hypothetical protein BS47DRAFT_1370016 [Hydnum rufescens UP504]
MNSAWSTALGRFFNDWQLPVLNCATTQPHNSPDRFRPGPRHDKKAQNDGPIGSMSNGNTPGDNAQNNNAPNDNAPNNDAPNDDVPNEDATDNNTPSSTAPNKDTMSTTPNETRPPAMCRMRAPRTTHRRGGCVVPYKVPLPA